MRPASLLATTILVAVASTPASAADLSKGEYMARAADCIACHTMSEGQPYAGGLKMATPVGAIYTPNITPDKDAGIGAYTLAEFDRAVRQGIAKDGRRLYPAMPYPSYAKLTDADVSAMYDFFLKEVKPVKQANTAPEISWPLNMRWPLAVWNWLMTEPGVYAAKGDYDAEWNRGAYLVQGAGHCGACHTPRGVAEQEKALDERDADFLAGGVLDNWSATNLRGDSNTGLGRWSEDDIFSFLKTGRSRFGSAFGTMREVVTYSTRFLDDADLKAIAKYLKSLPADVDRKQAVWVYDGRTFDDLKAGKTSQPGAAGYLRNCASCHGLDGRGGGDIPALAGNPAVLDADPVSLIRVVMNGTPTSNEPDAPKGPSMPQFRTFLKDQDIADVVGFIRSAWGNRVGNAPTAKRAADIRAQTAIDEDRNVILRMR